MNAFLRDFSLLQIEWPAWELSANEQSVPDHSVVMNYTFCGSTEGTPEVTSVRVEVSRIYPRGVSRCFLLSHRDSLSTKAIHKGVPPPPTAVINGHLREGIDHILEVFIGYMEEIKELDDRVDSSGTLSLSQERQHETFQIQLTTVVDAHQCIISHPSSHNGPNSSNYYRKGDTTIESIVKASKDLLKFHMREVSLDGLCDIVYDEKITKFVVNIGIPLCAEGMSELRCRALGLAPLKRFFITTFHFPPEYANCASLQQISVVGVYLSDSIKVRHVSNVSDMSCGVHLCDPVVSFSSLKHTKLSSNDITHKEKGGTEIEDISTGDGGTTTLGNGEPVRCDISGPLPWLIQTRIKEALWKNDTMREWALSCFSQGCDGIEEEGNNNTLAKTKSRDSEKTNISGVGFSKTQSSYIAPSSLHCPIIPDIHFVFPEEKFYHLPNVLEGLRSCIEHRLRMCTERCVSCDDFLGVATLKIGVCKKDICTHVIENYAIFCDVLREITERPLVSELLIFLSLASAKTGNVRDTFDPMCTVHLQGTEECGKETVCKHTGSNSRLLLSSGCSPIKGKHKRINVVDVISKRHFFEDVYGGQKKDFALLEETISLIPPIREMVSMANGSNNALKRYLNTISPLVFPLLHWILASNHAHVEPIPPRLRFDSLGEYQFYLVTSNPEREKRFREHRRKAKQLRDSEFCNSGSFFAWHGSSPGNWHCILRNGLKNYSGTKLMSAGQLYGAGIYTAMSMGVSVPYMGSPVVNWPGAEFINGDNGFLVLALCEVAAARTGWKKHPNGIVTVQDEDLISTRFLFLFPNGVPTECMDKVILRVPRELLMP